MIVVSDATPLNVLVRTSDIDILRALFGRIVLPTAVAQELSRPGTPEIVRAWIAGAPPWIAIRSPSSVLADAPRNRGEREAISLAVELHADLLLADDKGARAAARTQGLRVVGTIGVLELGAARGLVDLAGAFERLRALGDFRSREELFREALARHRARPGPGGTLRP